jgi:hypothetical protein
MPNAIFFKKSNVSRIVAAGGPAPEDQILAIANNKYWTVLNTQLLRHCARGSLLCEKANAFKHALQTYGPSHNKLPDLRQNEGKSKSHVFHGHMNDANGTTYVLEWAIVDLKNRVMALTGFETHENYKFRQVPLSEAERVKILTAPKNIKIFIDATRKIEETKAKVGRTEQNYRLMEPSNPASNSFSRR